MKQIMNSNGRDYFLFQEYISELQKKFSWEELSYFELNLETWRQLWRVLEMSDIVLIIVDIRYCVSTCFWNYYFILFTQSERIQVFLLSFSNFDNTF